jgi:hypothetical protein
MISHEITYHSELQHAAGVLLFSPCAASKWVWFYVGRATNRFHSSPCTTEKESYVATRTGFFLIREHRVHERLQASKRRAHSVHECLQVSKCRAHSVHECLQVPKCRAHSVHGRLQVPKCRAHSVHECLQVPKCRAHSVHAYLQVSTSRAHRAHAYKIPKSVELY